MKKSNFNPVVYAALYLNKKSPTEKVSYGNGIIGAMTGSAVFVTPVPALTDYQTTVNNLNTAINTAESSGSPADKQNVLVMESAFDTETRRLADYVQNTANASATATAKEIILSAAMQTRKTPERHPLPEQPLVKAKFTDIAGTVKLIITAGKYANIFNVYQSLTPGDPTSFVLCAQVSKRSSMISGLTSGARYYFKVIPRSAAGFGPASPLANMVAA